MRFGLARAAVAPHRDVFVHVRSGFAPTGFRRPGMWSLGRARATAAAADRLSFSGLNWAANRRMLRAVHDEEESTCEDEIF